MQIMQKQKTKSYIVIFTLLLFFLFLGQISCQESKPEVIDQPNKNKLSFTGTWVTNVASTALNSKEDIQKTVESCVNNHIDNIFMVVWNNGRTIYPSSIMKNLINIEISEKYQGRDPLKEMIEEAHKHNIKVHAWFEYGFSSSYNANGGLIIEKKPDWAAKDQNGKLVTKNGFDWMNPLHPEVQEFMLSLIMEVVNNYNIDGIQGDDRLPALPSTGGYDPYTIDLYKKQHTGNTPPSDYKNQEWINWRAKILTEFLSKMYQTIKQAKPNIIISSAPSVYPWGYTEYLQDWPTWLSKNYIDMVIPQIYRYNIDSYQKTLSEQLRYVGAKDRHKIFPGMLIQNGDYNPDSVFLEKMIEANRRNGILGEAFWFFEGIKKFPSFFETYNTTIP
jgi:uncharacterized lipoprotein YddW (UPF0748 family)